MSKSTAIAATVILGSLFGTATAIHYSDTQIVFSADSVIVNASPFGIHTSSIIDNRGISTAVTGNGSDIMLGIDDGSFYINRYNY